MGKLKVVATHIGIWLAYISLAIINHSYKKIHWQDYAYEIFFSYLISAAIFYSIVFLALPKFWPRRKYLVSISLIIVILLFSISLRFLFAYFISPNLIKVQISAVSRGADQQAITYLLQGATFIIAAALYWSKSSKISLQKRLAAQIAENTSKEKLELEIAALRAQINPHFTINSLELFRAQSAETDPKVSNGIGWFMKILRAGIVAPDQDGKILLKTETEAIKGTIFIFTERFPEIQLEHNLEIDDDDARIYPHILFPFVENAFKHGSYEEKEKKIKVNLLVKDGWIKLEVFNKKGNRIKDKSTGIGLRYVRRHLESGYPQKHNLIINETEETFSISLSLQIN